VPTYKRPGVFVGETLNANPALPSPGTSTAAFLGEWYRGPSTPVFCQSWGDFVAQFGGFQSTALPVLGNPWLGYSVYNFFNNGGSACWVGRIVGDSGVSASEVFSDQAATPLPTLTLTALNQGTWANQLFADISSRTPGRFDLVLYLGGTTVSNVVERWLDMSMSSTDPRYVVSLINSPIAGSNYVSVMNDNSPTAAPSNAPAPVTGIQFTSGADPTDPTVTERIAAVTAGTSPLDLVHGILNLNLPGETNTGVLNAALTYAVNRGNIFVVPDVPQGQTPAQAVAFLQSLNPTSYGALYYPWLIGTDPSNPSMSALKTQPPGGFVLGKIAQSDSRRAVWYAPAGTSTVFQGVTGTERKLADADLDTLNSANVNAIKQTLNRGTMIWGTRTLVTSYPDQYIPIRRTLMYIEDALITGTQWAVFEPNDQSLWTMLTSVVSTFLTGIWQAGGLAGSTADQAFYVLCDGTINTAQTIQQGIVNVQVGVSLQYPAEFISFMLGQWQGGSSVTPVAA
jgi:phage tail sheath protein FI